MEVRAVSTNIYRSRKGTRLAGEFANPRKLEAANDFRLCKAEAYKVEKDRIGGMANVACQEYKDAGVIQQTTEAAATAAAREDVVRPLGDYGGSKETRCRLQRWPKVP